MKLEVKSIKLMFLYRNLKFKSIEFYTNNKEYKEIVKILNIKDRRNRLEYIYDEAVKYINKYYSEDLCKFENGQCIVQRKNNGQDYNGCCKRCPLVTDKGCPSVNLPCKLIYCKTALKNIKKLKFSDILILKCLTLGQQMVLRSSFFHTREEILRNLNYGLIYSVFMSFKRCVFMNKKD